MELGRDRSTFFDEEAQGSDYEELYEVERRKLKRIRDGTDDEQEGLQINRNIQ
jgi:hypothetical protein